MELHQRNNLIISVLIPNSKSDKYFEPAFHSHLLLYLLFSHPCSLLHTLEKEGMHAFWRGKVVESCPQPSAM